MAPFAGLGLVILGLSAQIEPARAHDHLEERTMVADAFKSLNDRFAVHGQISEADLIAAKEAGYEVVINNRPDEELRGEGFSSDEARSKAEELGLTYIYAPVSSTGIRDEHLAAVDEALGADGKVLAHCLSGMRSVAAWAFAEARRGERSVDDILTDARNAGFSIDQMRGALESVAPS